MRVVLDANIFVSALISRQGNPAITVDRWLAGEFDVLVSRPIIDEILRVTGYERILKKYARVRENRLEFAALISDQGVWVEPPHRLSVVSADESDNRYLECAVAGGAQYIVTGDQHLLAIRHYQGIEIVSPAVFVALLETDNT
ncbi:MAG: putative toxin-antitoxin system toxin component, PIN family [Candidatus Nealsonbacteria bacterium]|nr:putative toxin-antitoxin system toxin component, PIN family [Candidatus Nealsonbacteria bacterium]